MTAEKAKSLDWTRDGYPVDVDEGLIIAQEEADMADGAALRRLREAWPPSAGYWQLYPDHREGWNIAVTKPDQYEAEEWYSGATIAEAADKCREALK